MSKLKYIKIILVLLLKSYLIYLWVNFVGAFTQLLYYIWLCHNKWLILTRNSV